MHLGQILHAALGKSALIVCCCCIIVPVWNIVLYCRADVLCTNSINHSVSTGAPDPVIFVTEQEVSISADAGGLAEQHKRRYKKKQRQLTSHSACPHLQLPDLQIWLISENKYIV